MRTVIAALLTVAVAAIALRIERLNAEAGDLLPRHEYRDDNPAEGLVTWRAWATTGPTGSAADRRATANNRLLAFVGTFGLAQYALVPALAVVAAGVGRPRGWRWAVVPMAVAGGAGFAMWYRDYFGSLGS